MLPHKRVRLSDDTEEKGAEITKAVLSKSIESFADDLCRYITEDEEGNFVHSGLSVYLVLSMCAFGARKKTAKQMLEVLHLDKDALSSDFKSIITDFKNLRDITLNVVNRVFVDKSIVLKDSFKQYVTDSFLSDVVNVDFANQPESAVSAINNWCAKSTNNKINQILSPRDVNSLTRMILTNAVYFKARWLDKFSLFTNHQPFYIDKDTTIDFPTMYANRRFLYKNLPKLNAECIAIPYKNRDYFFVIVKPNEIDGLKQLETDLAKNELDNSDKIGKVNDFLHSHVRFQLPKFKIVSKINVTKVLHKLGMTKAFGAKANFKDISEEPVLIPPLHIQNIFQKAFIEVNEEGTEAAAVTYTCMRGGRGGRGPSIQWRDFKVDRPFLYRIVNGRNNLTLFSGRIVRPTYV